MFRFAKFLFYTSLICLLGASLWFAFGIWSGLYSVYSYPPSKDHPKGATLIVEREDGEPMFNSPDHIPPKEKPIDKKGGIGFGKARGRSVRPIERRTILEFPYIEWAYEQSIKPGEQKKE
jgi:hypothetical protein